MGFLAELILSAIFLGTGSLNTISSKVMYQTKGFNKAGELQYYDRPWLSTFIMFLGEAACFLIYLGFFIYYKCSDEKVEPTEEKECEYDQKEEVTVAPPKEKGLLDFISRKEVLSSPFGGFGWKYPFIVALFAFCDLIATTLMSIGLLYCNASIIQMCRGFVIVFTMLLSWAFLKRKPVLNQVVGVLFSVSGLIVVGGSAIGQQTSVEGNSAGKTILGIGLTLAGQVFAATQFVLEEKILKQNDEKRTPIPALFLVGSEGVAGSILCVAVALPIVDAIPGPDFGSYENMANSFYMLTQNDLILGISFLYFFSIAFFNWSGFVFSKVLSATSRTLMDALRTIIVWIVMVILYYASKKVYGESVSLWSILQGAGFILMMFGTVIHNNIAGFGNKVTSCCKKESEDEREENNSSNSSEENKPAAL